MLVKIDEHSLDNMTLYGTTALNGGYIYLNDGTMHSYYISSDILHDGQWLLQQNIDSQIHTGNMS